MPQPAFITWQLIVSIIVILVVIHMLLGLAGAGTYLERKISAYIQDRIGPNRVGLDLGLPALSFLKGLFGLGQFLADGLKFILKEDYTPRGVDKSLFTLAPIVVVIPALIGFVIIPWGGNLSLPQATIPVLNWTLPAQVVSIAGANVNVGIVYILAVAALSIYGITLAGWASNNKYSFLGALRSSAQMISYEIPMGLAILTVLLMVGSLNPDRIIAHQVEHGWLIFAHPVVAVIFYICALAECNRAPFDNAEAESELVGGYHTEYGAMRWALFFLAEYSHLVVGSAFFAMLFLGGYHLPATWVGASEHHWLHPANTNVIGVIAKFHVFLGKTMLLVFLAMLVRWTLPRLKFDQVMSMAWNGAIPLSIAFVLGTSVLIAFDYPGLVPMLMMNIAFALVFGLLAPASTRQTRVSRMRIAGSRFYPVLGETVVTGVTNPAARQDDPVRGTLPL
jgi:NADH-quinone oxidoreductase subunit H